MLFDEVSILVVGFDGYKDVWNHCFNLMNKYWSDRPNTYLATSELIPTYNKVNILPAGKNSEWSRKASNALRQIKTPYVVLLLEDFFITDYVNNKVFENILKIVKDNRIKFYKLKNQNFFWQKLNSPLYENYEHIHIISSATEYPLNLQPGLWDREFLLQRIGEKNYNAWFFEINHFKYSINRNKIEFLEDDRNPLNITHAILQSEYLPSAIKKMKEIGYVIESKERKVMSLFDYSKYLLKKIMSYYTPFILRKPFKLLAKLLRINIVTDRHKTKSDSSVTK